MAKFSKVYRCCFRPFFSHVSLLFKRFLLFEFQSLFLFSRNLAINLLYNKVVWPVLMQQNHVVLQTSGLVCKDQLFLLIFTNFSAHRFLEVTMNKANHVPPCLSHISRNVMRLRSTKSRQQDFNFRGRLFGLKVKLVSEIKLSLPNCSNTQGLRRKIDKATELCNKYFVGECKSFIGQRRIYRQQFGLNCSDCTNGRF